MDLSSDSDDCQLYTRTAQNIAIKKQMLDKERDEIALRMKFLPDELVPGVFHMFDRVDDSPKNPVTTDVDLILSSSDSEDEIPLSLLRKSLRQKVSRNKRKSNFNSTQPSKKKKKPSRPRPYCEDSSDSALSYATRQPTPNYVNEIPTVILDDDTGYPTTSFAPICFNSRKHISDCSDSIITLDDVQANYDVENYEDLDTLVKVSVDWKSNKVVGSKIHHFQLRRYQKFETVFEELCKMEGIPINQVVLMRNFDTIRPRDTPASLNLTYYGHLVGHISKAGFDHSLPKLSETEYDYKKRPEGELKVKLLLDSKSSLSLTICKNQKMNILYKKCSEELNIPVSKVKILFDGEEVQQQDAVSELGIEDGDALDVLIKKG